MEREVIHAPTTDGARIACKRRAANGTPIIFLHGLAVNADLWDVPRVRTPDGVFESLPSQLHAGGHDIWLVNLRGHGRGDCRSEPAPGSKDWSVDHFIHFDLPAVVEHVRRERGREPLLIGNSMGAMTIAGWLTGARWTGGPEPPRIDGAESARRQGSIAGCVLIEFPAALRWPRSAYGPADDGGLLRVMSERRLLGDDHNYLFELLARSFWTETLLGLAGRIPLEWLRPRRGRSSVDWEKLGEQDAPQRWIDRARDRGLKLFAERFKGGVNFEPALLVHGMLPAVDHIKAGVLRQLGDSVRARGFVSSGRGDRLAYSSHYGRIQCPVLTVMGGRDRIANSAVTREDFHDRLASPDRTFLHFENMAHGDFEYSMAACREVYPAILDWVRSRADG